MEQPCPLGRLGGKDGDLGAGIDEGTEGRCWVVAEAMMMAVVGPTSRRRGIMAMVVRADGDAAGNAKKTTAVAAATAGNGVSSPNNDGMTI